MASTWVGSDYATITEPGTSPPGTPVILDVPVPAGVSDGDDLFVMVTTACLDAETPGWEAFGGLGPIADSHYMFHRIAESEPASHSFQLYFNAIAPTFLMGSMAAWTLDHTIGVAGARSGGGIGLTSPVTFNFPSAFTFAADISCAGVMAWHGNGVTTDYPTVSWDADFTERASHNAEVDFSGDILVHTIAWADAPVTSNIIPATSTTVTKGSGAGSNVNTRHFRTEASGLFHGVGYWGIHSVLAP